MKSKKSFRWWMGFISAIWVILFILGQFLMSVYKAIEITWRLLGWE